MKIKILTPNSASMPASQPALGALSCEPSLAQFRAFFIFHRGDQEARAVARRRLLCQAAPSSNAIVEPGLAPTPSRGERGAPQSASPDFDFTYWLTAGPAKVQPAVHFSLPAFIAQLSSAWLQLRRRFESRIGPSASVPGGGTQ